LNNYDSLFTIDIQPTYYIYSILFFGRLMMQSETSVTASRSNIRKKPIQKSDDNDKITERMEGGILVRRHKGRKIEIE